MTLQTKRLFLIDGSGYIYRAFYALPPMTRASDNTPVNAVFGFTSMLMNFVKENPNDCMAVVFDTDRKNFRNTIFPDYKANRTEVPADLIPQFSLIRKAVDALGIASVEKEGYEADDLIASYAKQAVQCGYDVVIVSADKDLTQLMNPPKISVYDPMKKRFVSHDDVFKKFGVLPDKVVEVQALMGDSTDNIPGVKGIGPKTAAELIIQYGSLDGIYEHLSEITGRKHDLLAQDKQNAYMSLKLATLATDAPLPKSINDFCCFSPDMAKIKSFLETMEFKALLARLPSFGFDKMTPNTSTQEIIRPEIERKYECVQDEKTLLKWCEKIKTAGFVALDTETNSLDSQTAEIAGISLCVNEGEACYIPINHYEKKLPESGQLGLFETANIVRPQQLSKEFIKTHLLTLLADSNITKIGHNIKFDLKVLHTNFGIDLSDDNLQDTIVMSYDLDGMSHSNKLDDLALLFLNEKMIPYTEVCKSGKNEITFNEAPVEQATSYSAEDADMTMRLYHVLSKKLETSEQKNVYENIDRPLIKVLTQMENEGVLVDKSALQQLSFVFNEKITMLEKQICDMAGEQFNVNSPVQLGEILFEKMALEGGKRNAKSKNWSTDSDVLEELAENGIEIASKILDYRQYNKLKSTYTDSLVKLINPRTGKVHTTFSQTMTATGRLSSNNPNLQNIPIRTEDGRLIRSAFIAPKGHMLMSADYSQVELRLMACVADVKQLQSDFAAGLDIHAATASQIFGVPVEGMDPMIRRQAKAINFGIIYGISAFGLARQLGISRTDAKRYIDSYFEKYKEIKTYMDQTIQFASDNGYVLTPFGRKCYISGMQNQATKGFASRAAINAPIQGGAADIIKMAMIKMQNELQIRGLKSKMLLQVHDELVFDVPENEVNIMQSVVKNVMENVVRLPVPLIAEIGVGKNWKEAH
ncbi:MAG: DNA polymerase I [Alphaproteobacteria bacterium]